MEESIVESCVFCDKYKDDCKLIEMNTNFLDLKGEICEFSEIIKNVLDAELRHENSLFICEECKDMLIQFHNFRNGIKNNSYFIQNENIDKVKIFLEETQEHVYCLRYNKCLSLVPESKRRFMDSFQHWQPAVVIEKLSEIEPRRKKMRMDKEIIIENNQDIVTTEEIEEVDNFVIEDISQTTMNEEEWLTSEIHNSAVNEYIDNIEVHSWICAHCEVPSKFTDETDFRNHLISMHLNVEQSFDDYIQIDNEDHITDNDEINYQTEDSTSYETKTKKNSVNLECKHCTFITNNPFNYRIHQQTHLVQRKSYSNSSKYEKLFCVECCYQFTTKSHFESHINGHQLYEIVAKYLVHPICHQCNVMFCDDSYYNEHIEKHNQGLSIIESIPVEGFFLRFGENKSEIDQNDNDVIIDESCITCGHCLKKFTDEISCRLHQLIFHVNVLKCPVENRLFNSNQAYGIHLKNNHPELFGDDVKFPCSACKQEFNTLYEKLAHMKTCDKKKFACTHCDKKFRLKCYLIKHLRQTSGQTSIACEVCDKICTDKGDYQIHIRSHSNEKPFACSICPKAYKTSSARAAHLETHMEGGFDCMFCNIKCKSRRILQKHMKTKHSESIEVRSKDVEIISYIEK